MTASKHDIFTAAQQTSKATKIDEERARLTAINWDLHNTLALITDAWNEAEDRDDYREAEGAKTACEICLRHIREVEQELADLD